MLCRPRIVELNLALKYLEIDRQDEWGVSDVDDVLETYMISYILRFDLQNLEPGALPILKQRMYEVDPNWEEARAFLCEVRRQTGYHKKHFSRSDPEDTPESIGNQYGRWQDKECKELKRNCC